MRVIYLEKEGLNTVVEIQRGPLFSNTERADGASFIDINTEVLPEQPYEWGASPLLCIDLDTKELFYNYSRINYTYLVDDIARETSKNLMRVQTGNEQMAGVDPSIINIDDVRNLKITCLKQDCTGAIYKGFKSKSIGEEFGFNKLDQENFAQQLAIIVSGDYNQTIRWKTLDGNIVTLTKEQFMTLVAEASEHKLINQNKYWKLEQQVLGMDNAFDIVALQW